MQGIPPGYGGPIQEPSVNDVLSGRGGRINSHPGNVQFRQLVNKYKHVYLSKQTKKLEKVNIADKIVKAIRSMDPPGRFLKEDTRIQMWVEIGDQRARKKAGQAMRENAEETRKDLAEQETNDGDLNNNNVLGEPNTRHGILQQTAMSGNGYMYPSAANRFGGESSNSSPSHAFGQNLYGANFDLRNDSPSQNFEYRNQDGHGFAARVLHNQSFAHEHFPSTNTNGPGHLSFGQRPTSTGFATMSNYGIQNNNVDHGSICHPQLLQHANAVSSLHDRGTMGQQSYRITEGIANVFDRDFQTSVHSNSSGSGSQSVTASGAQSLNVSGYDSTKRSSSSSILSLISAGILSPNELLFLASQPQPQHHQQQQQQHHQQHFGYAMNTLNEGGEWNANIWDQNLISSRDLQYTNTDETHGTQKEVSEMNCVSNPNSIQNQDRRRLFRENREQSHMILPTGLKQAASNAGKQDLRESQLLKESIGTLDSMTNINLSSMGMGSTNILSMYPKSGSMDYDANAFTEQAPRAFIGDNTDRSGINPTTNSNESLMKVLAEAASKSERLSSESSLQSSNGRDTFFSKSADTSGSIPTTDSSRRSFSSPSSNNVDNVGIRSTIKSRVEDDDDNKNRPVFATAPFTNPEYNALIFETNDNYQRILPIARRESYVYGSDMNPTDFHCQQNSTNTESDQRNINNSLNFSHDDIITDLGRMRAQPQRILTRRISGISLKSDVSMGDLSWNHDLARLGSLQAIGDFDMNESARFRLFSENSARSLMSDLSENMSALDLASLDMASRRDLLATFLTNRRESITRVNNMEAFQESTDDVNMDS